MDLIKLNRYVYFIPGKRYRKNRIGKIINVDDGNILVKWEGGVKTIEKNKARLLYENLYIYFDYLKNIEKSQRNYIRHLSKLYDDILVENFYLFPKNNITESLIEDICRNSHTEKEINILYHYLKKEIRKISFEIFEFDGDFNNPIDRAKNLKNLEVKIKQLI